MCVNPISLTLRARIRAQASQGVATSHLDQVDRHFPERRDFGSITLGLSKWRDFRSILLAN